MHKRSKKPSCRKIVPKLPELDQREICGTQQPQFSPFKEKLRATVARLRVDGRP
jgi:hypothetical protein